MGDIVDIKQYKNKRQEFTESLQVHNEQGKILVPNIERHDRQQYRENDRKSKERYRAKKGTKTRAAQKAKRLRKFIALIAATTAVGFGGLTACNAHKEANRPISLEMAMENGKDLTDLGIDQEIVEELEYLKIEVENADDLNTDEVEEKGYEVIDLQKDIVKTKIHKATGANKQDIKLIPSENGEPARIIAGEKSYIQKDIGNLLIKMDEMTSDFSKYIDEIVIMQNVMEDYENGKSTRTDLLKHYKEALNGIDRLAASEIELNEKGDLVMNITKVSEIENSKQSEIENNNQKEDDGR